MRHLSIRSSILKSTTVYKNPEATEETADDSSESGIEDEADECEYHEDECEEDECHACRERRTVAMVNTLPVPVTVGRWPINTS